MKIRYILTPKTKAIIAAFAFSVFGMSAFGQGGQFIQAWAGPQYVSILNFDDFYPQNFSDYFSGGSTYRMAGGLEYINNFNPNYGWQTGIYYSGQGQKYSGTIINYYKEHDPVLHDSNAYRYDSKATMDYIRVPLMFRFNSEMNDNDRVNLSIFMGFQVGYLFAVKSVTTPNSIPDSTWAKYKNFDLKQLYNTLDFGLGAGAQINVRLTNHLYTSAGIRFDRSIGNIENKNFHLPDDAPLEFQFPLSTMKDVRTSYDDELARMPSKHISLNVNISIAYKIKEGKPVRKHPVEDDAPQNQ